MPSAFHLHPYRDEDEDAAISLWQRSWQEAYPSIDFASRATWSRERWRDELVPDASIIVADQAGKLVGFVTIDARGYLDQLVVAPDHWGTELADSLTNEAKRLSPDGITLLVNTDNAARSASTSATALSMQATTSTRPQENRCCGCSGRRAPAVRGRCYTPRKSTPIVSTTYAIARTSNACDASMIGTDTCA
jgi:putative acetyltransferase